MKDSLENLKKENGITLVALVITVVVMLILAGVAIAAVVDGDGLFGKTRQAAESYEDAARDEADQIKTLMNEIDNYLGNVDDGDDEDNNPPAGGATIGEIVDKNKTFDGQTEGTYNNPIIPKGFAPVNENGADWGTEDGYQKGLVIRDAIGNDFVWVPVDGTIVKFERIEWGTGDLEKDDCEENINLIEDNVNKNGGFYIARYEAGQLVNGKTISKQGATVYKEINWTNSKKLAEEMYTESDDNYGAVSTLIYGTQWDTALKFIGAYDVGEVGYNIYATNSTGMGNYKGTSGGDDIASISEPTSCGARNAFRQKNIYDMAGNLYEWTMETYGTTKVVRGGDFDNGSGLDYPASHRVGDDPTLTTFSLRFSCSTLYKVAMSPKEH